MGRQLDLVFDCPFTAPSTHPLPFALTDIEVVKVVLLLTGAVNALDSRLAAHLATFDAFAPLWVEDVQDNYKAFLERNPDWHDFDVRLAELQDVYFDLVV